MNFHGDVIDGEVSVVGADGELWDRLRWQHLPDLPFDWLGDRERLGASDSSGRDTATRLLGEVVTKTTLPRSIQFGGIQARAGDAPTFIRSVRPGSPLIWRSASVPEPVGLRDGSWMQSQFDEPANNRWSADPEVLGHSGDGVAVSVHLAEVLAADVLPGGHWVYNLTSSTGLVWSPAMLHSNCRCTVVYYWPGDPEIEGLETKTVIGEPKPQDPMFDQGARSTGRPYGTVSDTAGEGYNPDDDGEFVIVDNYISADDYAEFGSKQINGALRRGEVFQDQVDFVTMMDDAFREAQVRGSMFRQGDTLLRGVGQGADLDWTEGVEWLDPGYSSVARNLGSMSNVERTVTSFANGGDSATISARLVGRESLTDQGVVMRIRMTRDTPFIRGEAELGEAILPRQGEYRVVRFQPAFTDADGVTWPPMADVDYTPPDLGELLPPDEFNPW
jgi:hypothetical protein